MRFRPVSPDALVRTIATALPETTVRIAIDGAPCASPAQLGDALAETLATTRPAAHVRGESFWRDASLRLEYGREDVESYLTWLDADALRREVLDPVVGGSYLPSLRDPVTNRSTREAVRAAASGTALIVSGTFLLGRELPFDVSVHLRMSPAARARRTPPAERWTLPAFDAYDERVGPSDVADVVVRYDDPRHPAVGWT